MLNQNAMRPTTQVRHQKIKERFDSLYAQKIEGISLDLDSLMKKLADDYGYSIRTIGKILKGK